YENLAVMLQRANVREAGYRVRLAPQGKGSRTGAADEGSQWGKLPEPDGAGGRPSGGAPLDSYPAYDLPPMPHLGRLQSEVEHRVFHDFLEHGHSRYERPLEGGYYQQVERELREVERSAPAEPVDEQVLQQQRMQYREVTAVDRPAR